MTVLELIERLQKQDECLHVFAHPWARIVSVSEYDGYVVLWTEVENDEEKAA